MLYFIIRWLLFLIACMLLPNLFTIVVACVLFALRLWVFLVDSFDHAGNAKGVTRAGNLFNVTLVFFETAFTAYFLMAYFL